MKNFFTDYFNLMTSQMKNVDQIMLSETADLFKSISESGKKIILAGNGASAGIASHISVDLTKNAGIRAINFNEPDLMTCFANDFGYEKIYEKSVEFYADKGDILVLISCSGRSLSVVNAAKKAKKLGVKVLTFTGFNSDNPLKQLGDINFWVNSKAYNHIETIHSAWLVSIVDKCIGKIEYSA